MFGTPSTTPAFGTPSTSSAFGTPSTTPAFGTPSATSAFGTPQTVPAFGSLSTPSFATPSTTPAFATPAASPPTPAFATPSFSAFTPSPFSQQQQQPNPPFATIPHLTTQMAPVAPIPSPLVERDVQAIVDAYRRDPSNPKYSFRHLLFSVTNPTARVKPLGVSDIMWAEAVGKLEGMDSSNRERLWPELVQGFEGLSSRLKLQDEVIVSDAERLKENQKNVKLLQRHFQADILPRVQLLGQKEQSLQRRLLRVMRIIEVLQCRGLRVPLTKSEFELQEKLSSISKQLKTPGNGLSKRVQNLLSVVRLRANAGLVGSGIYLPASTKIEEQNLARLQEVMQQETEAISKIGNVLKKDARDVEIILSEGMDPSVDGAQRWSS